MNKFIKMCVVGSIATYVVGCNVVSDPSVHDVIKEASSAAKEFSEGKSTFTPGNKKVSVQARLKENNNYNYEQNAPAPVQLVVLSAATLEPKKKEIHFSANIPKDLLTNKNELASITTAFNEIGKCADEYDTKSKEASKISNPLADSKLPDSGCRFSGLTYNDQPAVDISSEKNPGVFVRIITVAGKK